MFRWLEKKAKTALFEKALAAKGASGFYPKSFLNDVIEASLSSAEKEAKVSYLMGVDFDLEASWQEKAEWDATALSINAMCVLRPDAFNEASLKMGLLPSPDAAIAALELSPLLDAHRLPNNMALVSDALL